MLQLGVTSTLVKAGRHKFYWLNFREKCVTLYKFLTWKCIFRRRPIVNLSLRRTVSVVSVGKKHE